MTLDFGPVVSAFISAVARGTAEEIAAFSPRGEGKTWGALGAMIAHAQQHQAAGYPLPVLWAGVTDTLQSHKDKTHESLLAPGWAGVWTIVDGGHEARAIVDGQVLVRLRLFGIEDRGAMNRLRRECHGVWFEEPAPALDVSSGITEDAWAMAKPSARLPSHCNPLMLTSNYPDLDHWTWQRFVERRHPATVYFRVPKGESPHITDAQREKWAVALEGRPDLKRRLLDGEPGFVILGEQVAVGYNADTHVARDPIALLPALPLWMGWDSAPNAHCHATVIGQVVGGVCRLVAGLVTEAGGMKQHLEREVLPWLERRAPWVLASESRLEHRYDPAMDTEEGGDIDQSPILRVRASLGGTAFPGPVAWAARAGPMLAIFQAAVNGAPALQIDPGPDTELLRKALMGRWYYARNAQGTVVRDLPQKPNHPWEDLGDAFAYLIGGMAPQRIPEKPTPRAALKYGRILGAMR